MSKGFSNMLKLISCGTRPRSRIASSRWAKRSTPKIDTVPALALTSELTMPIRVLLPAPLGPSRAKKSPGCTLSETPFRASVLLS
jgi:hypothetical protein